ncbi:hypothetical protein [Rivularia sp. UHCC 0363]|uniref:hypothetical protein n=1 Tax=Rivularia sp. UHCC 0363 TaxID=3110244 RepID=UPI002B1EB97C|nr:hypothetical protein [Rivularia sp. UHCC 0363]MEA5598998.1 hypothetical protein [Rivularia sp. UHCC 0363]
MIQHRSSHMYLPEKPENNRFSSRPASDNKKLKPHSPADPVGKRYVQCFYHPHGAIVALTPCGEEKPAWRTISYYLQASTLWNYHQDPSKLVGIRFGNNTKFGVIDLDDGGDYHNPESVKKIQHALENIGITDIVPIQSSYSGGYHLIIPFSTQITTFSLACALEIALRKAGLSIRQGHLEVFPNAKPYGSNTVTNYNAIRCPMQPHSGALLLDDDLEPIGDSVEVFLDHCDRASCRQDLTKLKRFARKARKTITKERYSKFYSKDALSWRTDWEEIIATGWTGKGQTNTYLQILVGYGIVFLGLEYSELVKYALEVATNAPGYTEYCGHQHEIEARVRQWAKNSINNKWYSEYASYPERPRETFAATFAEIIAGGGNTRKPKTKDNVIPFDRRKAQSEQRSQEAQRRIRWSVKALEWSTGLPEGITDRTLAISAEYKRSFGKTISRETLRKYLHLWHPNFYVEDPWAENSSNACQTDKYGYFNQQISVDQNKNAQNPSQMGEYGYFSYMKVLCLPPADASPQGESSASEVSDQVECVEVESPEIENVNIFNNSNNQPNSEIENPEIENCFDNSNNELNPEIENSENLENPEIIENVNNLNNFNDSNNESNNSNDSSECLNNFKPIENNSDKYSKYPHGCGAAENGDNKNLSINLDRADCTVPSSSSVPPEVEELKRATRLRLKALFDAQKAVRTYCVITGRLLLGQERSRLEQIAKYQFYMDSGCSVLVAEAEAWAAVNPGCLPFSLQSAFNERADE